LYGFTTSMPKFILANYISIFLLFLLIVLNVADMMA
jgi:hypothetical protein